MSIVMGRVVQSVFALTLAWVAACDGGATQDDADADVADADAEVAETDADVETPTCLIGACPNDPPDGPVGAPCTADTDCSTSGRCRSAFPVTWAGRERTLWSGGYCHIDAVALGHACPAGDESVCPTGARCVVLRSTAGFPGGFYEGCLDACAPLDPGGAPWNSNCDCRDGYRCDPVAQVCLPGCGSDADCCEVWRDHDEDGEQDEWEVTALGPDRCLDTCDPCTFTCVRIGCPGGGCGIGDACEFDQDCPAGGTCLPEPTYPEFPGGWCIVPGCDVADVCPSGSACGDLGGGGAGAYAACVIPCDPMTGPGDPGFPCRDFDPPGPSPGDAACVPVAASFWVDGVPPALGYCRPGNFPGGDGTLGEACANDGDCLSPRGLGRCLSLEAPPAMLCTALCNAETARGGFCDEVASPGDIAACVAGLCLTACDAPGGPLGSTGCPSPLACQPVDGIGFPVTPAAGVPVPPGVCFPACLCNEDCTVWNSPLAATCDPTSGTCR